MRYVLQSANGRFKRWRYLDRTVPNTQTPYIGDYVWIISAICNRYTPPLSSAKAEEVTAIVVKMLYLSCQLNELRNLIETKGTHRRSFTWTKLVASGVASEFHQLSEVEIREITLGTYKVKMAKSYTHEHINEDGSCEIHVNEDTENVVSTRIQSRHVSAKKYYC